MWILLLQGHPEERFSPTLGLPRWGCYRPTSAPGSLMWFGRTWRGRAGPKVISRAVTSETHFPTIKEREKLSGPNIARFHGIESNICMCVCVCVCVCVYVCVSCTSPPQSLTDTHTLLSHPKQWQSISKCVYLQRKPLATKKWEILSLKQM